MSQPLGDRDWKTLLRRIEKGRSTPIIGDDALPDGQPRQTDIARRWAKKYGYPMPDASDLAQVAQFATVTIGDPLVPKEEMLDLLNSAPPFDPNQPKDIHNMLADLPFPVYLTTNYGREMTIALEARRKKPRRELCRWNQLLAHEPSVFDDTGGFEPDPSNPIVYHLYGYDELAESIVMTEDDHLDYLVGISLNNHAAIPPRIRRALAEPSLLFIGYQLSNLSFRVLFRGITHAIQGLGRTLNLAVQLPPEAQPIIDYLEAYFEDFADLRVKVYWGTADEFAEELDDRWRMFNA